MVSVLFGLFLLHYFYQLYSTSKFFFIQKFIYSTEWHIQFSSGSVAYMNKKEDSQTYNDRLTERYK